MGFRGRAWIAGFALAVGMVIAVGPAVALPFMHHRPPIVRHKVKVGDWQLDVARNGFSGDVACRLSSRNNHATYQADAIGFRFSRSWDVHDAVYRFDGGAPQQWRDDLPELVRIGAPIDAAGIENASGGIVWIPWSRMHDVNSIAIQARGDRKARVFHLRGLRGLLEVAVMRGCSPDSRFVR